MRKSAPRAALGNDGPIRSRYRGGQQDGGRDRKPDQGDSSSIWASRRCAPTLAAIAEASTMTTTATCLKEYVACRRIFDDRRVFLLGKRCRDTGDEQRKPGRDIGMKHGKGADARDPDIVVVVSPITLPAPPALAAATIAAR